MALPVSVNASSGFYAQIQNSLLVLLGHAQQLQAAIAANSISPNLVLNTLANIVSVNNLSTTIQANNALLTGVEQLYASNYGVTTGVAASALGTMMTALIALGAAIKTDFPKAADGTHLACQTLDASANVQTDTFTAAQLPTTATALTAWLATVS